MYLYTYSAGQIYMESVFQIRGWSKGKNQASENLSWQIKE